MDKNIKIIYVPVNQLNGAEYNPRKWSEEQSKKLSQSIKKFGLVDPLIVNSAKERKDIVIGGHFRLKVAKDLGFSSVPVVYLNIPSIQKEKELNLRLNRNTGEWDIELLKEFNMDLLLDVGFDDSDLSHIWDENLGIEDDDFDIEKELAEIQTPQTKLGDVYQLGQHRLICGDSTNLEVIQELIGKDKISMLYFDPPYNINLDYNKGIGAKSSYGGKKTKDNKSTEDYKQFLKSTLENGLHFIKDDAHVFCWCDEKYIGLLQSLYSELGIENKRVCLWIKNNSNMTPQIAFNKVYEPCVYGTKGSPYLSSKVTNINEVFNKEIGTGNRVPDDILDLLNIWLAKRVAGQDYEHPTEKPPTLHEKALRRCTKPSDIILDLFGGSGSTLIACEQLKRKAFLCEIEPIFCDLIIRRYEKLTGGRAKKCK